MKYALDYHVVPIMALTTVTAAATDSAFVNMKNYQWVDFLVHIGTLTGDVMTMTVEEATANVSTSSTPVTMPFVYRQSSAVGTDSLGTATTCASTGVAAADTDDNTLWVLSVDPSTMTDGYSYLRVSLAEGSSTSASVKGVTALLYPKYAQATALSTS
jgi:hypothetical protein